MPKWCWEHVATCIVLTKYSAWFIAHVLIWVENCGEPIAQCGAAIKSSYYSDAIWVICEFVADFIPKSAWTRTRLWIVGVQGWIQRGVLVIMVLQPLICKLKKYFLSHEESWIWIIQKMFFLHYHSDFIHKNSLVLDLYFASSRHVCCHDKLLLTLNMINKQRQIEEKQKLFQCGWNSRKQLITYIFKGKMCQVMPEATGITRQGPQHEAKSRWAWFQ